MPFKSIQILIVENENNSLIELASILRSAGFSVKKAPLSASIVQYITEPLPDLILIDCRGAHRECQSICHDLKTNPTVKRLPIIGISRADSVETKEEVFESGAVDYISEPIVPQEVLARIEAALLRISESEIQAEQHQSEEIYRVLSQNTPDHILMQDLNLRYLYVANPQLGLTTEDMIGKTDDDFLTPEDAAMLTSIKRRVIETEEPHFLEVPLRGKDGRVEYFEGSYTPWYSQSGSIAGLLGYFRNVTARKEAELELQENRNLLDVMGEMTKTGGWEMDVQSGKQVWTDETYKIHDRDCNTYSPNSDEEISRFTPEFHDAFQTAFNDALEKGVPYDLEAEMITRKGNRKWVRAICTPIVVDGAVQKLKGVVQDITERKLKEFEREHLDEQMIQMQKLESLGVLAGGIAHDFNNLLAGIFGYIELARQISDNNEVKESLDTALAAMGRAKALTHQLLTFSKGGVPIKECRALGPIILKSVSFGLSGTNVASHFYEEDSIALCEFDPGQIGQVIDNLVINAVHAMPDGGVLDISIQNCAVTGDNDINLTPGNYVKIVIADTGKGIPLDILPNIFDPYFTTKETGHGLGLSVCFSIISRHGGTINAESKVENGTAFTIYLPAVDDAVREGTEENRSSGEQNQLNGEDAGIFVIMDDEEVVRTFIARTLKRMGYTVVTCANGQDAVDILREEYDAGRKVAGAIFDLTVQSGIGGEKAVQIVRTFDTETPIFVASGYAQDPIMANPGEYGFNGRLQKPFLIDELISILREKKASS